MQPARYFHASEKRKRSSVVRDAWGEENGLWVVGGTWLRTGALLAHDLAKEVLVSGISVVTSDFAVDLDEIRRARVVSR